MSDVKENVRERYADSARRLEDAPDGTPPTLGLGEVVELAALRPGETVLDLGSGPGRDLLAAARAVGPTGRAIGVDFTPEMIERARHAAHEAGLENVSIVDGDLERLPVPCGAVDVVISNCVINLVPDKRRALVEAFRALRPGGRLAILDTAFETEPGDAVRNDPAKWCGCVGGSLVRSEYEGMLRDIGFDDVRVERQSAECCEGDCSTDDLAALSVAVSATKPGSTEPRVRPAVPSDRLEGMRTEDAIVALDGGRVVGAIAVERSGALARLTGPVGSGSHELIVAALEVARWSGATEVAASGDRSVYEPFGFDAELRLDFERTDVPLLGKPSTKQVPSFDNGSCC